MSSNWKEVQFSKLCKITRGASPRPIKDFMSHVGMPWVKIADATSSDSRFIESTKEKIKIEGVAKSKKVYPGDLILSNSATPGLPKFMKIEACIHDGWMLLRDFKGLNKNFAYWLLLHERKNLVMQGNGSVFTNLKTDILKNHTVKIPDEIEQEKIANVLDGLQDKIELNTQTNQTLEQIAQALFKSWFVDFDPVKEKIAVLEAGGTTEEAELAAMSMISAKSSEQLAELKQSKPDAYDQLAQTAALFPSAMQESELGEIPEGWSVSTIGEEVHISGGGTPSTKNKDFWENGSIHWTTPKDLSNLRDKVLADTERKITEAGLEKISSGLLPVNTVLMSSRAPVGYLALTKVPVAINQGYIAMRCEKLLSPEFTLQWATSNMDEIKQRASGTTFAEISKKNFRPISVVVPTEGIIKKYSDQAQPLYEKIYAAVEETRALSSIRDTLLPQLLSGNKPLKEHIA